MSRTYRRKAKNTTRHWKKCTSAKQRRGDTQSFSKELPAVYKNAKRMRCVSSNSTKWWFHSREAAIEAAKYNCQRKTMENKPRKYERAYFCHSCNGYHLTTMNLDEWQSRKAELARVQGLELDKNGNFIDPKPTNKYPDIM